MNYSEWATSQFEARVITEGKHKGWICFRTPLFDYTISREDWECIKRKLTKI